jgi:hypothetical protein
MAGGSAYEATEKEALMTTHTTVSPHRSVDARGRALHRTEAELRARAEEVARGLDALAEMVDGTDTDEVWERFTRELDEDRLSKRKRFR